MSDRLSGGVDHSKKVIYGWCLLFLLLNFPMSNQYNHGVIMNLDLNVTVILDIFPVTTVP